ncbi:MAG: helix-turn-helix transcriptional regulator [Bellilinea sp.]|jgi:transcriptional regulator with XRE-family HTH domain
MEKPIAKARRESVQAPYDPEPLISRVKDLLKKHNESYREASLRAGLDHQAIRRIFAGQKPQMHICILLADHFGVNPNEFLQMAGWPILNAFEVRSLEHESLSPEVVDVAVAIQKIPSPGKRKEVAEAILTLVEKYFE